jgi:hypothetical protein
VQRLLFVRQVDFQTGDDGVSRDRNRSERNSNGNRGGRARDPRWEKEGWKIGKKCGALLTRACIASYFVMSETWYRWGQQRPQDAVPRSPAGGWRGSAQSPRRSTRRHRLPRPGDDLANARYAPRHCVDRCLRGRLFPQEAVHREKRARDKAPRLGQHLQTGAALRGERPGCDLAARPMTTHAPTTFPWAHRLPRPHTHRHKSGVALSCELFKASRSMQTFVVTKSAGPWQCASFQHTRMQP